MVVWGLSINMALAGLLWAKDITMCISALRCWLGFEWIN